MADQNDAPAAPPPDSPQSPKERVTAKGNGTREAAKHPYGPRLSRVERAAMLEVLRKTGSEGVAARHIGRSPDTLAEWKRLGRAGVRFYRQLAYDIERAKSAALFRLHAKVTIEALKEDASTPARPIAADVQAKLGIERGRLALAYLDRMDPELSERALRLRRPVLSGEVEAGAGAAAAEGAGAKAGARVRFTLSWAEDGSDLDIPGPPLGGASALLDAPAFRADAPGGNGGGGAGGNGDEPDE